MNDAQVRSIIAAILLNHARPTDFEQACEWADMLLINSYAKLAGPQAPTTSHKEKNP